LPASERWRSRLRTARAIADLSLARLVVAALPFSRWRESLGGVAGSRSSDALSTQARCLAAHVEWAAKWVPFSTKCLPRAMALSWILRRKRIAHVVVFAVRPAALRGSDDQLHAWVEHAGETLIGDLPGPWVETLRLGEPPTPK
jgi:hypothetical protein